MLKAKDLINQSVEELEAQYEDLSREIFELLNELKLARKLDKPHLLKEKKRDRARILTVLRQKQVKGA
ncbi:MAG: 50S ribosomal protein L29 [Simkania sp.]|uniref:Large ribosomal subunit protein uL29 n=1 Tax=Simkania negevensis (strain ATCC VR-1471 / DSM 27360 / Z) TaxID=331113 RepID=F8L3W7_SIMNZ|nr:50S ribosomal protein L29 [Simkania negevensis]MCB1067273.1 50S ribosomal protein L29 [Simkania sp.]MCP5489710.1 50S ribosomal protein L29 [Chlamydiales bacterium]MCB1074440.1 50S ribosomal protein L29 [Simkania sp.]MCB1083249.1 50S ribosomal protein L29 [Simkania sp.]CCB89997.1 50S ribosomal protein L29 [Simkania negevensis Z]